jgi:hypothetical protein
MPMLAYLDALLAALAARDTSEIDRLLAHPLARILSPDALADATAERHAAASGAPPGAPLNVLQLRDRTAQLLGSQANAVETADAPDSADLPDPAGRKRPAPRAAVWSDRRAPTFSQMELPLSA